MWRRWNIEELPLLKILNPDILLLELPEVYDTAVDTERCPQHRVGQPLQQQDEIDPRYKSGDI